ncbi:hypothetical protein M3J09_010418 [Ascochyta lentis]
MIFFRELSPKSWSPQQSQHTISLHERREYRALLDATIFLLIALSSFPLHCFP